MTLEERIHNIKTLLEYCPDSTDEVKLYDEVLKKFFYQFFNSQPERFEKPAFDGETLVRIGLYGILDKNLIERVNTIFLEYCYNYDRHNGSDMILYLLNNPDCYFREWHYPIIECSEIPDDIWERIENVLYNKALETINKELESAESNIKYWKDKKIKFMELCKYGKK